MNPDRCKQCRRVVDPFDPDYTVWDGHRWHVSCALVFVHKKLEVLRAKQQRQNITAEKYALMQIEIDELLDAYQSFQNISAEVPAQAEQLKSIFTRGTQLIKRSHNGSLLAGEVDPSTILNQTQPLRIE